MLKQVLSTSMILLTGCMCTSMANADDAVPLQKQAEASVSVRCQGRLRQGVVAIGGETTGTTITFQRITWELQLPDDASREFAEKHHKEPVVATGTLRQVVGTESHVRWIIEVTKLEGLDARLPGEEGCQVAIRGTMRARLAPKGDTPDLLVAVNEQFWRLDFGDDAASRTAATSLIGQAVLLTGDFVSVAEDSERKVTTPLVRVKKIAPLTK